MASPDHPELLRLLKEHFGYDTFRPLQEEIVLATMAGRDVLALLPTGGGKSLCFQLPAMAGNGLTLVVSPLIALMKDQVDQLTAAGIPAAFLNSTLDAAEARHRLQGLEDGRYRLLYAAPERVMQPGFAGELRRWGVERIAIDEAHCVSEWGHDFRPEYRMLPALRRELPGVPVIALTATATDQVREDIVEQLALEDPARFTASFNRPNLTYRVTPRAKAYETVLEFVRSRGEDSGIVDHHHETFLRWTIRSRSDARNGMVSNWSGRTRSQSTPGGRRSRLPVRTSSRSVATMSSGESCASITTSLSATI